MESIIKKLKDADVVTFKIFKETSSVRVRERCDRFFSCHLSKDELLMLAKEVQQLAGQLD